MASQLCLLTFPQRPRLEIAHAVTSDLRSRHTPTVDAKAPSSGAGVVPDGGNGLHRQQGATLIDPGLRLMYYFYYY